VSTVTHLTPPARNLSEEDRGAYQQAKCS